MNNIMSFLGNNQKLLLKGKFGLEKENIRVDKNGSIVQTPHPEVFGDKESHPYITVDFSESQLEMITPALQSVKEAYYFLQNIHEVVITNLNNEYLWPQSTPPILPENLQDIPLARLEKNVSSVEYRERLAEKYGRKKQLLSGIHFNFSFDEELLQSLYKNYNDISVSYREFTDDIYLKVVRNYFKHSWLMVYLLGSSPFLHESYGDCCESEECDSDCLTKLISFRNSFCGYKNNKKFYVNHQNINEYINSIENLISDGTLSGAREYYSPIRLKSKSSDILKGLKEDGVAYLELRSIDLNPLSDVGIFLEDLQFIHMFLIYLLLIDCDGQSSAEYLDYINKSEIIASCGRGDKETINEYTEMILNDMQNVLLKANVFTDEFQDVLEIQRQKLNSTYAERILNQIESAGFVQYHMERAKESKDTLLHTIYTLKGHEDLELSTQILLKDSILRGVKYEILDHQENFIRLSHEDNVQYVKQATKTSLDSYVTTLIMENKSITKRVLSEKGISVPKGKEYFSVQDALDDRNLYSKGVVVKPKSTNFGLGISIIKDAVTDENYNKALEIAFAEDNTVLIEEFVKGKEYRFFVVGDELVAVLHRVPANVKGNGVNTILELVNIKNQDPLRGKGYKTPLENLSIGESEKLFLQMQGLDEHFIPQDGQIVYLRENSNISTGGDSIDFTDDIHESYKTIAVQSAKYVGAKICGVDMMIQDISREASLDNHAIIELNFNPAIHIHCYPYEGENRHIAKKLLDLLGY